MASRASFLQSSNRQRVISLYGLSMRRKEHPRVTELNKMEIIKKKNNFPEQSTLRAAILSLLNAKDRSSGSRCDNDRELMEKLPGAEEKIWENKTVCAGKYSATGGCNAGGSWGWLYRGEGALSRAGRRWGS